MRDVKQARARIAALAGDVDREHDRGLRLHRFVGFDLSVDALEQAIAEYRKVQREEQRA